MDEQIFEGLGKTRPFVLVEEIPQLIRVREANLAIELVRFVILRGKLLFLRLAAGWKPEEIADAFSFILHSLWLSDIMHKELTDNVNAKKG